MGKKQERTERERLLMLEPGTLDRVCEAVANHGSLGAWCQQHDVRFHSVYGWIHADRHRLAAYSAALEARAARMTDKVQARIETLLDADPRKAFSRGRMLPIQKLPDSVAGAVAEVTQGRHGSRLKLVAPDRAVELAGRSLGMFRDKVEVSGEVGISSRLQAARQRAGRPK